jgi:hypothetical protein
MENCKFLLENCDLYQCHQHSPGVCEQLFDVLEQVCSTQDFKWLFQLQKKLIKRPTVPTAPQQETSRATDSNVLCSSGLVVRAEPSHSSEGGDNRNTAPGSEVGSNVVNNEVNWEEVTSLAEEVASIPWD